MKCDFTIARRGVARLLAACSGLLRDNEQTTQLRAHCASMLGNISSQLPPVQLQSLFKTRDKVQQGNFGKAQGSFVVVWIPHERDQMRETN